MQLDRKFHQKTETVYTYIREQFEFSFPLQSIFYYPADQRSCVSEVHSRRISSTLVRKHEEEMEHVKLEYLDVTVLRRGVEVRVVVGRAPAC
jgi:hypothetical protein